jgi:class 3 adenylate cyclase
VVIDPVALLRRRDAQTPAASTAAEPTSRAGGAAAAAGPSLVAQLTTSPPLPDLSGHMLALLFADVVGFSKLTEAEMPLFVEHFLKPVAALCERGEGFPAPVQRNTWGDGLYFVFRSVATPGGLRWSCATRSRGRTGWPRGSASR